MFLVMKLIFSVAENYCMYSMTILSISLAKAMFNVANICMGPYIQSFSFKSHLIQTKSVQGRFFVCPHFFCQKNFDTVFYFR